MKKLSFLIILSLTFTLTNLCQQSATIKICKQAITKPTIPENYENEFQKLKEETLSTMKELCKKEWELIEQKKLIDKLKKDKTKKTKLEEIIQEKEKTKGQIYFLKCKSKQQKTKANFLMRQAAHKNAWRQVEAAELKLQAANQKFEAARLRFKKP